MKSLDNKPTLLQTFKCTYCNKEHQFSSSVASELTYESLDGGQHDEYYIEDTEVTCPETGRTIYIQIDDVDLLVTKYSLIDDNGDIVTSQTSTAPSTSNTPSTHTQITPFPIQTPTPTQTSTSTQTPQKYIFSPPDFTYGHKDTNTLKDAQEQLDDIAQLKENWNDNDASPFTERLINIVQRTLPSLEVVPLIFPTAADSIQLEYENDTTYLEFTIYETYFNYFIDVHPNHYYSVTSNERLPISNLAYTINLMLNLYFLNNKEK